MGLKIVNQRGNDNNIIFFNNVIIIIIIIIIIKTDKTVFISPFSFPLSYHFAVIFSVSLG